MPAPLGRQTLLELGRRRGVRPCQARFHGGRLND
jgi:hypothetical protein